MVALGCNGHHPHHWNGNSGGRKPWPPCGQLGQTVPECPPLAPPHLSVCLCRVSSEILIALLLGLPGKKGSLHPLATQIRGKNTGPSPTAAPGGPLSPRTGTTPSSHPRFYPLNRHE